LTKFILYALLKTTRLYNWDLWCALCIHQRRHGPKGNFKFFVVWLRK